MQDRIVAQSPMQFLAEIPYSDPTSDEIDEMFDYFEAGNRESFKYAKSKLTLHYAMPDSLTRRADKVIGRFALPPRRSLTRQDEIDAESLEYHLDVIQRVFDKRVTIHKAEIDKKRHVKIWFTPRRPFDGDPTYEDWLQVAGRYGNGY